MPDPQTMRAEWDRLAPAWIAATAAGENAHREHLLDDWMLRGCGNVAGKHVIDLACGEGRFSRMLAERGATVLGVDACAAFIDYAKQHAVGTDMYELGDAQNLSAADGSFDLAVSYVALIDMADFDAAIGEAARVLKPGGRFVASTLHPMTTAIHFEDSPWLKDEKGQKQHLRVDTYSDEGPRDVWLGPAFGRDRLTNYHRRLSTQVNTMIAAGLRIDAIHEPVADSDVAREHPSVADHVRAPNFILFEATKQP